MKLQDTPFTPIPKGSNVNSYYNDRNKPIYRDTQNSNLVFNKKMFYPHSANSFQQERDAQFSNNYYGVGKNRGFSSYNGNQFQSESEILKTQMKYNNMNNNRQSNDYYYLNIKSNLRKFLDVFLNL
jgi:hypothetical protein